MKSLVKKFICDEKGLETVEYAIIGALVVAVGIATIYALGQAVKGRFEDLTDAVNTQPQ